MSRRWGAVLAGLLLLASCSSGDDDSTEPPRPGERTTTTEAVDRSGIVLAPVAGETTTTIRETGTARLVGTVRGPAGPVPGAVVRIERMVAGREIRSDVVTGPDGAFALDAVPGGRYRVRAFLAPTLAQVEPEIRFLADGEEHSFDLVVESHGGLVVRAAAAPTPPLLDQPVNVVVLVARRVVDGDGVVRTSPISGLQVELVGLGRWVARSDDGGGSTTSTTTFPGGTTSTSRPFDASTRTDGSGRVRYELECRTSGSPGLAIRVPVTDAADPPGAAPDGAGESTTTTAAPQTRLETIPLDLPACIDPATTTTTTVASSGQQTSTTEDG